ncbi:hypothetical protein UlMin_018323 [Ulmus minor]
MTWPSLLFSTSLLFVDFEVEFQHVHPSLSHFSIPLSVPLLSLQNVRRADLMLSAVTPIPLIHPKLEPGLGLNTFALYRPKGDFQLIWAIYDHGDDGDQCDGNGGILFKIYIVGKSIKVVRRFSLPDVSKCELEEVAGVFHFPRVSCAAATADEADLDPSIAELPQRPLLEKLAKELSRMSDVFYVIDINYFPGYGKMPEYEHIFTYFLLSLMQNKYKKRADA